MPLIHYLCSCGYSASKFFRTAKESTSTLKCPKCNGDQKRQLSTSNIKSIITVDNGVQARQVEVDLDLVKDIKDRSTKDFKNK